MNDGTPIRPTRNVELGASGEEFQNLHEFVRKARSRLNQNAWDYIVGAAETETTMRRNRMALDEIAFRPRVLRNVAKVDASTEVLGRRLRLPVMIAPVGALEIFDPNSGAAVAHGAGQFGAAHMLSSVSEPGLEATAKAAPDALRIFQLYVRGDDAFVEDTVSRSIDNGYAAFCLTVDTAHYSRRERDIAKRYVRESRIRATGGDFQKGLEWRTVKLIKDKYKIPLVIKGIATAEDAAIALDHGVDWIYVSNHGGRQLDHGRGSMHVLPEIVDAVAGRAKIMVDGSFCRGTDIVKAIASGADLVGIGRLQCWALAAARRSRHRADAGAAGRRGYPRSGAARRHPPCRTRQVLPACGDADEPAERVQRLSTAGYRTLSLLRRAAAPRVFRLNRSVISELVARRGTRRASPYYQVRPGRRPKHESDLPWSSSRKRMAEDPFAQFDLEKAIGLRWTLRDIQARRLKMSPVSDEDLRTLTDLGLVDVRDEGLVLTPAGTAVLNGS